MRKVTPALSLSVALRVMGLAVLGTVLTLCEAAVREALAAPALTVRFTVAGLESVVPSLA
jgi:hypothetical protein